MSPDYKRWYDHDPTLMQILELLRNYKKELKEQAQLFLDKLEEKVSRETIDKFYDMVKPIDGKRWYDKDPVISKTVELLRVIPPDAQKAAAENFKNVLKEMGIDCEVLHITD